MEDTPRSYVPIEDLEFFRDFVRLSDDVWREVRAWSPFDRDTVGVQLVKALDSVGANLVEGDGRYTDKEAIRFFVIARGSGREALYWIGSSIRRDLFKTIQSGEYVARLESILRRLNAVISHRRRTLWTTREQSEPYDLYIHDDPLDNPAVDRPDDSTSQ